MPSTIPQRGSALLALAALVLAACGGFSGDRTARSAPDPAEEAPAMSMEIRSDDFEPGGPIPTKFTGEGTDISPSLSWTGAPEGTRELALIVDDPDAPRAEPWVHWVLFSLSPETTELEEADNGGGIEGRNDFGDIGYGGPMPPPGHGVHHYHFRLYALDAPLDLAEGATKEDLLRAMDGHVLGEAEVVGTYRRD